MNIGIFTDTYYPKINGVVTSIRTLEQELTSQGHNVYIFTTTQSKELKKDDHIYRIPAMPLVLFADHKIGITYSPITLKAVKRLHLDVIHSQTEFSLGMFAKTAAKKYNIPIVHTYHTMYEDYVHYLSKFKLFKFSPNFARKYSKLFCNGVDAVIAPTEKTCNFLRSYDVTKPIHIIPTGINFAPFEKTSFESEEIISLRAQYGFSPTQPIIVFVGRLAKEKSVDIAIRAMPKLLKKLPEARFFIVGDGPAKSELESLADELGVSDAVVFAGQKSWDEIGKFYQIGDVFVSASVSETQGLTFAEAMAGSIPVIAKKDDNLNGMLEDRVTGRVFTKDEELPNIFFELLVDPIQRQKLAKNAYEAVQQFSSSAFGESVENLYYNVIEEKKAMQPTDKKKFTLPNFSRYKSD